MAKLVFGVVVGDDDRGITPLTITVAPHAAASTFVSRRSFELLAKAGYSNTPVGLWSPISIYTPLQVHDIRLSWVEGKEKRLHVPVPEDCLRLSDRLTIQLAALRPDIESKPPIGNTTLVRRRAGLGVLVELVGGDVVDWENELDALGLGLFYQPSNLLGSRLVEEGVADLWGWSVSGKTGGKDGAWKGRTLTPSRVFLKVKAMPPVIMSEST